MSDSVFLDTNIFVSCFESKAPEKQSYANSLVKNALVGGTNISWQVIQEFCNVALTKFKVPLSIDNLREYQELVLFPLCSVWPSEALYREALSVRLETGYGCYDSLIITSALRSTCKILYSEDMQHGSTYRGLKIINPFV